MFAFRELLCKLMEQVAFGADYLAGLLILFMLFPLIWIPKIDKITTRMLLWTKEPKNVELLRKPVPSTSQRRHRSGRQWVYGCLLVAHFLVLLSLFVVPLFVKLPKVSVTDMIAKFF